MSRETDNLKYYYRYAVYNGFGAGFIAKGPVMLLALYFGASNLQIGYISAIIHSAGISLLFLPVLFGGRNTVRVHAFIWLVRGAICLLYFTLPFVGQRFAVYTLMAVYTVYCFAREIGSVLNQITRRYLSTSDNTGAVLGRSSYNFHRSSLFARAISFIVTSFEKYSGLTNLLILQFIGIIANTAAAVQLLKLRCPETIEKYTGANLFDFLKASIRDREKRIVLTVKWLILTSQILMGFLVAFLKIELEYSTNMVFAYLILQSLAAITAAKTLIKFSDRTGSSPLIKLSSFILAALSLSWVFVGLGAGFIVPLALGFVTEYLLVFNRFLIMRLVLNKMTPGKEVTFMSMINFTASFLAFTAGMSGGLLIDIYEGMFGPQGNTFTFIFILSSLISMITAVLSGKLVSMKAEAVSYSGE